ncbi:hypothetical protein LUZ61_014962 [Rhynchospora tenuis]|uniref:BHLH domain-containing protein n=1 Tax=Rhynchospora tenuis TaxID=198213 RepID=A0AAD5WDI3_9POAL|nr:hypothetical protein LUZ61_014962 [Rhynchospora tenuis]
MDQTDLIEEYLVNGGVVGSDEELRFTLDNFCNPGVGIGDSYGNGCAFDPANSRKRERDEASSGPKLKACREKMRRDRLNDRFLELSSVLDPERPMKSDKAGILSDAVRAISELRKEAQNLKEMNRKLQETIKDTKAEKIETREEKLKLKADKEKLENQIKAMTAFPPPIAFHPIPIAPLNGHNPAGKPGTQFTAAYPNFAMWQWLPPTVLDTTHDPKMWPPNA